MANVQNNREVPDSEDEPLSSSPVDLAMMVPAKLRAAMSVPHQEAQDASQRGPRSLQDFAEPVANNVEASINGLGVPQEQAFVDDITPQNDRPFNPEEQHRADPGSPDADPQVNKKALATGTSAPDNPRDSDAGPVRQRDLSHAQNEVDEPEILFTTARNMKAMDSPKVSFDDAGCDNLHLEHVEGDTFHPIHQCENINRPAFNAQDERSEHTFAMGLDAKFEIRPSPAYAHSGLARAKSEQHRTQLPSSRFSNVDNAILQPERVLRASSLLMGYENADVIVNDIVNTSKLPFSHNAEATSSTTMPSLENSQADDKIKAIQLAESLNAERQTSLIAVASEEPLPSPIHDEPSIAQEEATPLVDDDTTKSVQRDNSQSIRGHAPSTREPSAAAVALSVDHAPPSAGSQPPAPKTQQEITVSELKAQKAALLHSLANLPAIQILIEEHAASVAEDLTDDGAPTEKDIFMAANRIVKDHIKLLHEYNELKDVGQGLMGLIADQRGVRIVEVQDEFGVGGED